VQLEKSMNCLKSSFEGVADWCEKHLEAEHGREIGMTFGAMLRGYGRLATLSPEWSDEQRNLEKSLLNAKAEELLLNLSIRFIVVKDQDKDENHPLEPGSIHTNMACDAGKRQQE
jgi:hypothetical protein